MDTITIDDVASVPELREVLSAECAKVPANVKSVEACPHRSLVATHTYNDRDGDTLTEESAECALINTALGFRHRLSRNLCMVCAEHGKPSTGNPFIRHMCARWAYLRTVRSLDPHATYPTTIDGIDKALAYIKADRNPGIALRLANTVIFSRPECLLDTDGALDGDKVVEMLARAGLAQLALKQRRETP